LLGTALGLMAASAAARLLSSVLYGVTYTDATSFVLAATSVLAVGLAASYFPAARASRTDPLVVLRSE
jgi:ABC-type antimicrobial peptide transport system permease subunit